MNLKINTLFWEHGTTNNTTSFWRKVDTVHTLLNFCKHVPAELWVVFLTWYAGCTWLWHGTSMWLFVFSTLLLRVVVYKLRWWMVAIWPTWSYLVSAFISMWEEIPQLCRFCYPSIVGRWLTTTQRRLKENANIPKVKPIISQAVLYIRWTLRSGCQRFRKPVSAKKCILRVHAGHVGRKILIS